MSYPEGWPSKEVRENMRADAAGEPLPHNLRKLPDTVQIDALFGGLVSDAEAIRLKCCCLSATCEECHPTLSRAWAKEHLRGAGIT